MRRYLRVRIESASLGRRPRTWRAASTTAALAAATALAGLALCWPAAHAESLRAPTTTVPSTTTPAGSGGAAIPRFTAEIGVRGFADPEAPQLVTITVSAGAALDGRVEVRSPSGATSSRLVQVAGGTSKTFRLVSGSGMFGGRLEVSLYDGDRLVNTRPLDLQPGSGVEVVAVGQAMAERVGELPDSVELAGGLGRAVVTTLTADIWELGQAALATFDTIIAASADLATLPDAQRRSLISWLNDGGILVLDDTLDLSALPAPWRPGAAGYALAGRGMVRVGEGAAGAGRWASLIAPTGQRGRENPNQFIEPGFVERIGMDLTRNSGLRLPRLGSMLLPLVIYVVVVAAGVYLVVRAMRRMTLAWVAIPAVAVLASVGLLIGGSSWRGTGRQAATSFVDCSAGGCSAQSTLLTYSRAGGTERVNVPPGWQLDTALASFIGRAGPGTDLRQDAAAGGAVLSERLDAGQITTTTLTGGAPLPGTGLTVRAAISGDVVTGTVTNGTGLTITKAAVVGPGGSKSVGTLAPGASAEFEIRARPAPLGGVSIDQMWPSPNGQPAPQWGVWGLAAMGRTMIPTGTVRAIGWVEERVVELAPDARHTTLISALAAVTAPGGLVSPGAVRAVVVRSPQTSFANGLEDTVIRYWLPATTSATVPMEIDAQAGIGSLDLLTDGGWRPVAVQGGRFRVPPAAIRDGVVIARILNRDLNAIGGALNETPLLQSVAGNR